MPNAIENTIINYKNAPNGRAFIGFAKSPLMNNPTGHGYLGVKMQTEDRELLQCAECGMWMKQITKDHLKTHNLTTREYKFKHGYNLTTGLTSDKLSERWSESAKKANRPPPPKRTGHYYNFSMERRNRSGTCPEQLKSRLINYINRFKRIPSSHHLANDGIALCGTLKQHFGTMNSALRHYGLPTRHKRGWNYEYWHNGKLLYVLDGKNPNYEEFYAILKTTFPNFFQPNAK